MAVWAFEGLLMVSVSNCHDASLAMKQPRSHLLQTALYCVHLCKDSKRCHTISDRCNAVVQVAHLSSQQHGFQHWPDRVSYVLQHLGLVRIMTLEASTLARHRQCMRYLYECARAGTDDQGVCSICAVL